MSERDKFLRPESLATIILCAATVAALVCANTSLASVYQHYINIPFEIRLGDTGLRKPLLLWINDGLMAIFFLLIGLELKREVLEGELSSLSQVALPLVGAIGGILVPAALYTLVASGSAEARPGWAIPIATDIAFALGVLAIFGSRVPKALKTFLLTLAVFDDLGAILIIAFVYTEKISWVAKALALLCFLVLVVLNRKGVTKLTPYCIVGVLMWLCVLKSGVHATLAGVLLGLVIPLRTGKQTEDSPLHRLEHQLHPWVVFLIVPLFAFANAGVNLTGLSLDSLLHPVTLGISLGLIVGKSLGVFGFSCLFIKLGKATLPEGSTFLSLFGVSVISGIGFTMSLFIGTLAFDSTWESMGSYVRLGVLSGSSVAVTFGLAILYFALSQPGTETVES